MHIATHAGLPLNAVIGPCVCKCVCLVWGYCRDGGRWVCWCRLRCCSECVTQGQTKGLWTDQTFHSGNQEPVARTLHAFQSKARSAREQSDPASSIKDLLDFNVCPRLDSQTILDRAIKMTFVFNPGLQTTRLPATPPSHHQSIMKERRERLLVGDFHTGRDPMHCFYGCGKMKL